MKTFRLSRIAGLLWFALGLPLCAYSQAYLTNGLVAYYPLNGNAQDASGNGHNGVMSSPAPTATTNNVGAKNGALHFAGASHISVTPTPFNVNSNWTISFMCILNPSPSVDNFLSTGNDTPNGLNLRYVAGSGLPWEFADASFPSSCSGTATNLPTVWNMVTVVRNGTVFQMFLDGATIAYATTTATSSDTGTLWIGAEQAGFPYYLSGSLCELRIYDRGLATNEVQQLYQYELTPPPCIPGAATATASVQNGYVVGALVTNPGCGYTNPPLVLFTGGGGTGATAVTSLTNGQVSHIIMTSDGIGYTSPPSVYLYLPPQITNQPAPVVLNAYGTASFSVGVNSIYDTMPLTYQWSLNGTNIAGATQTTLTVSNVTQGALGTYSVQVSDLVESVASSGAELGMYPYLVTTFPGAVEFWGQSPSFTVQAWGTGPLDYQWYFNGAAITGATNQTLSFNGIQTTNAGLYGVVVTSPLGSVTNIAEQVVVNPAQVSLGLYPGVTIGGFVGYTYTIQVSTNLSDTNSWQALTNLTLQQPVQLWVDTNVDASLPANPNRFYRIIPGQ